MINFITRFFNNGFGTKNDVGSQPESSASSTSSNDTPPDYKPSRFQRRDFQPKDIATANNDVHQLLVDYGTKKLTANKGLQDVKV